MKGPANPPDGTAAVDALLGALYASLSFSQGGRPDFGRLRSLFLPDARLVRIQAADVQLMDVERFVSTFEGHLTSGALTEFEEREIARRVDEFGPMAHVWSTYATTLTLGGVTSSRRGINSIQLVRRGEDWRVLSIVWTDEAPENPIPQRYLPVP